MHKGFCLNINKNKTPSTCELKQSQCPKYCVYENNECYSMDNDGLADKTKYCNNFLSLECQHDCFLWNKSLDLYKNPHT